MTMTKFRTGSGPHTGVHMIIVRDDLSVIIHRHPPMRPGGRSRRRSRSRRRARTGSCSTSTRPDRRRLQQTNFQLFGPITVKGDVQAAAAAAAVDDRERSTATTSRSKVVPTLRAIEPALDHDDRDRSERQAGEVHAVVRGAGARDLLPQGALRVLPHARLQPGRRRLHQRARRSKVTGSSATPGQADRRRAPARLRHVAALPADEGRRRRS